MIIIIIIIITLLNRYLAEHKLPTNWGDYKSTEIRTEQDKKKKNRKIHQNKSNQMLVFEERGKPEYQRKKPLRAE